MTIEAMKQGLETLEQIADELFSPFNDPPIRDAILALRTAIAEAEKQEPVAWYDSISGWTDFTFYKPHRKPSSPSAKWIPLYAAPPQAQRQWVGLTNKDIIEMWPETSTVGWDDIRLIEAKLKEKNHVAVD